MFHGFLHPNQLITQLKNIHVQKLLSKIAVIIASNLGFLISGKCIMITTVRNRSYILVVRNHYVLPYSFRMYMKLPSTAQDLHSHNTNF